MQRSCLLSWHPQKPQQSSVHSRTCDNQECDLMLVSLQGSTFGVSGPERSTPNGLICNGRRDSEVARGDTNKIENLCQGRTPRMGKEVANWETVFVSRVYQNVLAQNSKKLVKKADNPVNKGFRKIPQEETGKISPEHMSSSASLRAENTNSSHNQPQPHPYQNARS